MAERIRPTRSRASPFSLFAVVTAGAVTASIGIVAPALADPGYPSWDEIQNAKKSEATKKAEINRVTDLLGGLAAAADEASKQSQIAAEAYRNALEALSAAEQREKDLRSQADAAAKTAKTSQMRAGLIAAHLARSGGKDLSVDLFLNGDKATDLLHRLGSASKLSEQSQEIYREALQDENTAKSLADQADAAAVERKKLAADAEAKLASAQVAAKAAEDAYAEQVKYSDELYSQLATLKDTTAALEKERIEGIAAAEAAAAAEKAAADKAAAEQAAADKAAADKAAADKAAQDAANGGGGSGGGNSGGGNSGGGGGGDGGSGGGGNPAPAPPAPAPAPVPNGSVVETAISFAYAQLGKPYESPGDSWNTWDCSGLTKSAYGAAGVYIGTHSATNQYWTMAGQGRLVPYSQRQRGDLIFWGSGGDYYHVAIYLGNDRILEAADWGKPVREYYIWGGYDVAGMVGRPG
ncbi:C40 family peptidase [Leifsonia sp. Leaf264]|uniref:C40 family peptidase n=1 Tax=Leifsonia sp. Leaf264 TaxID=1736314 RepID=UPI0006FA518F|nr:C40 family peptidase [Leifsonia sp. Leaf264]KQO97530.1 hypothetical protein ASF30_13965 [Leifsonia sp. Leaf264]